MKANELMIGDWVLDTEFDKNIPDQVSIIEDCGRVWLEERNTYQSLEYCEPIPITTDILEKSGFKLQPTAHYYWGDEFVDIDIEEFTDGLWEVVVWNVEVDMLDCKIYISYVHELQHVLELCGIDRLEVRV